MFWLGFDPKSFPFCGVKDPNLTHYVVGPTKVSTKWYVNMLTVSVGYLNVTEDR